MRFEWDDAKAKTNRRKHGISFETAVRVFQDPNRKEFDNGTHDGEDRWVVYGNTGKFIIVTVIYTIRGADEDIVRIISARRANKNEQRAYYHV